AAGGILTAAQAESKTGYVDGDNPDATVDFISVVNRGYTLAASPQNGWIFTDEFTYPDANGWYKSGDYAITNEGDADVVMFIDAASVFSATISGRMYKPSEEEGGLIGWSVTGRTDTTAEPSITPLQAVVPVGTGATFTYLINGEVASDAYWTIFSGGMGQGGMEDGWDGPRYTFSADAAGNYAVEAARDSKGALSASADVKVVEIASIAVEGATQKNVKGEKNWAAVKGKGDVIIMVSLNPSDAGNVGEEKLKELISWTGGEEVKGNPLQRKISKDESQKVTVKAVCGTSEKEVDIWIIWSTIIIQRSGTKPADAATLQFFGKLTNQCGFIKMRDETGMFVGVGNVCAIVSLSPSGVGDVIKEGWDIKREKMVRRKIDGKIDPDKWDSKWSSDDATNNDEILVPKNDKLYSIDSPTIGFEAIGKNYKEHIERTNFNEWLEWHDDICSERVPWSFTGTWRNTPYLVGNVWARHLELDF
ncbi:MAG: hypothetical protein HP043_03200, partial [Dialister sp.]|nr:hypothetical protein [Dialister sp.]